MIKHVFRICAVFFLLTLLTGCGPTRKEYAINEALLIDQTRMLEDQLYRAHFEIQHLQDENASLRRRLGEPEKQEQSPVPFDQKNANQADPQNPALFPTGQAESPEEPLPAIDGSYYQPSTQYPAQNMQRYRTAQRGTMRQAAPYRAAQAPYPAQNTQGRLR